MLCINWFCRVLFVGKAICKFECLNMLVMYLVSWPVCVNVFHVHLFSCCCCDWCCLGVYCL